MNSFRLAPLQCLLLAALLSLGVGLFLPTAGTADARPNFLFILTDDLGYECCCSKVTVRENYCVRGIPR